MYKRSLLIFVAVFSGVMLQAQQTKRISGRIADELYSYWIMKPILPVRGIVLLIPSRGERPRQLFRHTSIPRHLAAKGFLTIVPEVDYALVLEKKTKNMLDDLVAAESARVKSPTTFFIGGFSSGGAVAAHYAEYLLSEGEDGSIDGVFLIDSPLDLARLYHAWVRLIDTACPDVIISEGEFIRKYIEEVAGGTPTEKRDHYEKLSAFSAADPVGGRARWLKDVPIRLYTEPDLVAMQQQYCADLTYENLNASDLDALAACLKKLGNTEVEYIKTDGRGLHSWNIVDPEDLVRWIERIQGLQNNGVH